MAPIRVAIALGSNLGDRHQHLVWASEQLAARLSNFRLSSFHETAPVGVPSPQPPYLNAAAVGETQEPARDLLAWLLGLEADRGRQRGTPLAARTLDLDLVLYGLAIVDEPGLHLPHPRFRARRFVLAPLAEVGADLVDPVTGLSVGQLLERLDKEGVGSGLARSQTRPPTTG